MRPLSHKEINIYPSGLPRKSKLEMSCRTTPAPQSQWQLIIATPFNPPCDMGENFKYLPLLSWIIGSSQVFISFSNYFVILSLHKLVHGDVSRWLRHRRTSQNLLSWIIASRLQVALFILLRKIVVRYFGTTSSFASLTFPLTK